MSEIQEIPEIKIKNSNGIRWYGETSWLRQLDVAGPILWLAKGNITIANKKGFNVTSEEQNKNIEGLIVRRLLNTGLRLSLRDIAKISIKIRTIFGRSNGNLFIIRFK